MRKWLVSLLIGVLVLLLPSHTTTVFADAASWVLYSNTRCSNITNDYVHFRVPAGAIQVEDINAYYTYATDPEHATSWDSIYSDKSYFKMEALDANFSTLQTWGGSYNWVFPSQTKYIKLIRYTTSTAWVQLRSIRLNGVSYDVTSSYWEWNWGPTLSAPANLRTTNITQSTITLAWDPVAGASDYVIWLNGTQTASSTECTYTISGLAANTSYSVAVAARASGQTGPQATLTVVTTPPTPTLSGSADQYSITLSWTVSGNATGLTYDVYRNGIKIAETTNQSFKDVNLCPQTTYNYWVIARNSAGSSESNHVSITTLEEPPPPDAPSVYLIGKTATSISVSWNAIAGATGYRVYLDGVLHALTTSTAFTFTDLTPGVTYAIVVQAYSQDQLGEPSAALQVTTVGVPGQPQITSVQAGPDWAQMTWAPGEGDPATRWRIYLSGTLMGELPAQQLTYRFEGLSIDTQYTVAVAGVNEAGEGSKAERAIETTYIEAPTSSPTLTLSATQTTISAQWSSVYAAAIYNVYLDGVLITSSQGNNTTLVGLRPGTNYTIEVSGVNPAGEGPRTSQTIMTRDGIPSLDARPYLSGFSARWTPQPGDPVSKYVLAVDGATTTETALTFYTDGQLGWKDGSTHQIDLTAFYGQWPCTTSITLVATVTEHPIEPQELTTSVAFSFRGLWPLIAFVTALGIGFSMFDFVKRVTRG